jgi:ankyrin repeat protein
VERGSLEDVSRLLDAGARVNGNPDSEDTPLGQACWRGRVAIVAELLGRGARTVFADGGSAPGAARHGAAHCNDPEGGPTMATQEEIDQAPYREIAALLSGAEVEGA